MHVSDTGFCFFISGTGYNDMYVLVSGFRHETLHQCFRHENVCFGHGNLCFRHQILYLYFMHLVLSLYLRQ